LSAWLVATPTPSDADETVTALVRYRTVEDAAMFASSSVARGAAQSEAPIGYSDVSKGIAIESPFSMVTVTRQQLKKLVSAEGVLSIGTQRLRQPAVALAARGRGC
jgi:hypothetical protein